MNKHDASEISFSVAEKIIDIKVPES